jgi:two-component system chemotaxis response regulator CheY
MIKEKQILDHFKDKSILVVDDEKFLRGIVTRLVEPFQVVEAGDGSYALFQLAANPQIGLVLCDFNMPRMDGLTFLREVRRGAAKVPNDLPVLMLTGHSDMGLVQTALALDVDGFIIKPVSSLTLATRLKHLVEKRTPVKAPAHYQGIDLGAVCERLLSPAPGPKDEETAGPGRLVRLADARPKDVLAADLCATSGEVLVVKDTPLSDRLIARLVELESLGIAPSDIVLTGSLLTV